ncbi:zinc finger and BTB domain-containing protein 41 [Pholidichthys leucotaenia]
MKKEACCTLRPRRGRQMSSSSDSAAHPSTARGYSIPGNSEQVPESAPYLRHLTMSQYSNNLLKFLNEDRTRQKFCDVSVSVSGKVYSAHKVVLAHGSSYFHAELSKNPAATTHVTLDHVEDSVFQHLLSFLYTAECVIEESDLPALTEAAQFLDMMDILKLLCEEHGVHPVSVIQTPVETRASPNLEAQSNCPGDNGLIRSQRNVDCALAIHEKSVQDHLADSQTDAQQDISTEKAKVTSQRSAITRRSARTRKAPTKFRKDDREHCSSAPDDKQRLELSKQQVESRSEEERKIAMKTPTSELDEDKTPKPLQVEEAMDDEEEEEEGGDMNTLKVAQKKDAEVCGADISAGQQGVNAEISQGQVVGVPAAGSSSQSLVYPEGLAPVIIQTSNKKTLKCPKCDKTFDRAAKYESHTRVHTGEKPFQCDICLQRYSTKSNMTVHKKKHTSNTPFQKKEHKCPFCSKLHASKKTLAKHVRRFHPDHIQEFLSKRKKKNEGWKCNICFKTFTRRPHLQEHMILHTQDRPFKCSFCDEYFKSRFARLKHQEKFHLGPFPCEICGRQFNDTGNRKRHMECTHGGKRKWTCFICGKSVRERTTLKEHLRIHSGEKPHLCSICGQSFRHGSSYRLHLRVHHDDKRYECDICGKTFIRHDHLTKHQKIHSGEKAHQCEECGKCFRRHDHLTVHYKTVHLGEKVWQKYKTAVHQCEVCKKEFKGKSSLEMHFRTHSGEKPHRCPECHQTFRIKKTLTKHMVIHSDARPFNCPHCSATFKRKDKLKYHVDHVHNARFTEHPLTTVSTDKIASVPYEETSKGYNTEPKSTHQNSPPNINVCVPVTLVPVQMAGVVQLDLNAHRTSPHSSQTHSVISMQGQGQQQSSGYQATDMAFLEKYALTPQPGNIVHPVRPDQMLDHRDQSYLGTFLGLDSASSVQNISNSDHTH